MHITYNGILKTILRALLKPRTKSGLIEEFDVENVVFFLILFDLVERILGRFKPVVMPRASLGEPGPALKISGLPVGPPCN